MALPDLALTVPFSLLKPFFDFFRAIQFLQLLKYPRLMLHSKMKVNDFWMGCELTTILSASDMFPNVFLQLLVISKGSVASITVEFVLRNSTKLKQK